MDLLNGFADIRDGIRLTPLWWRVGLEQTVTRYRRTILGPFWLASYTLSSAFAIAVVFGSIFGNDMRSSLPYIVGGIVAWSITGAMLSDGANTFFSASSIMQSQRLPLSFHVFLQVDKLYINFAHQIVAFWAVLAVFRLLPIPHWQLIPGLALAFATSTFLYIPLGMVAMRFRDVNYMIGFVASALFMLTPVFWHRGQISPKLQWIVSYNPFAHLLEIIRQPMLGHPAPISDWYASLAFFGICAVSALLSLAVYRRRVVFWL